MARVKLCPNCHHPNPPTGDFCGECGASLMAAPLVENGPAPAPPEHAAPAEPAAPEQGSANAGGAAVLALPWREIEIHGVLFIGRDEKFSPLGAEIAGRDLDAVSRQHAVLRFQGGVLDVCDQRSTNGTFVNGRRLEPHRRERLADGDEVSFSSTLVAKVKRLS